MQKPRKLLDGLLVLDLALFLAGPYAALRLQDLGARVIKIERPDGGDPCRDLYKTDGQTVSTLFHAINRGKESLAIDLKAKAGRDAFLALVAKADVVIQNFRPGVAERLGLGYEDLCKINPGLVYASISGYGPEGEWAHLPGQDLLAQARSGIMWLTGNADQPPVPTGLAMADIYTGANATQAVLAALVAKGQTGMGALVETSLLESMIDMQFEMLTEYLNGGRQAPQRSSIANANVNAPPPYGVYQTRDGWLALAMNPLRKLAEVLELPGLEPFFPPRRLSTAERDDAKRLIAEQVATRTTAAWLSVMEPEGIWCAPVLDWEAMLQEPAVRRLDQFGSFESTTGLAVQTTRPPMRIDGQRPSTDRPAPDLGANNLALSQEFGLALEAVS
ncbi:CaiB/BaiF CoA-transferase family protein [Caulobacter sp. X]|uniref:CaiB/BaiF CoA transferase family protein n=1 Tax=Caulobacter sp. X TaxID=2048901 RepID=UPI000C15F916|nr:CaiB/BaiF CoA-transferase family protein [Caulobacter sp. X]PIB95246.1 CoA transferase [Caulobacter sp. X]